MYPTNQQSNIGNLLRLIQEEKSTNPAIASPGNEVASPIRDVIQGPIQAPESPGSSRTISARPEGIAAPGSETPGQVVAPVAPVPVAAQAGPVAPIAPVAPVSGLASSGSISAPAVSSPSINRSVALSAKPSVLSATISSLPKLSTAIKASAAVNKPRNIPAPSRIGPAGAIGGTLAAASKKTTNLSSLLPEIGSRVLNKLLLPLSFTVPGLIAPKGSPSRTTGSKVY